jgi:TonB family protein
VTQSDQLPLRTTFSRFAPYLNGMHRQIHPLFSDWFLESLDALPADHPLNNRRLVTRLDIVLAADGRVTRMGVVRSSGVLAFDIAALDSVDRAQPFNPPPSDIVSTDGSVHLHWEFRRAAEYACSTLGVRPFLIEPSARPGTPAGR